MRENENGGFWPALLGIWLVEVFGIFIVYLGVSGKVGNMILSYLGADPTPHAVAINAVVGIGGLAIMFVAGVGVAKVIRIRNSD